MPVIQVDENYSVYMHCWECHMWGTPMPENKDTCGNCGGHDVTIYYPSIQLSLSGYNAPVDSI